MRALCEGSWGNKEYMITSDRQNTAICLLYEVRTAQRTVCERDTHQFMFYAKQYMHCT